MVKSIQTICVKVVPEKNSYKDIMWINLIHLAMKYFSRSDSPFLLYEYEDWQFNSLGFLANEALPFPLGLVTCVDIIFVAWFPSDLCLIV